MRRAGSPTPATSYRINLYEHRCQRRQDVEKDRDLITSALSCIFLGARGPLTARGCPVTGGGENLAIIDNYYVPPRRRPERTGASYHNKLLTVTRQDGEGLVWGLSPLVLHVERPSREDQGPHNIRLRRAPAPVLFNELIGVRVSTE